MRGWIIPTVWLFAFMITFNAGTAWAERPATVLLITSKDLAPAWQDFADWKTSLGKATKIVTVQEIEAKHKGKDIQDKIRACVLDHIDKHGTHWVVLGGDSKPGGKGHVPDRDTLHPMMRYRDIPTDVYFLSKKKLGHQRRRHLRRLGQRSQGYLLHQRQSQHRSHSCGQR